MKHTINSFVHTTKSNISTVAYLLLSIAFSFIMASCANSGMDDVKVGSQSFLGTPCQHDGCLCTAFKGHINLNGFFYGKCKDCGHSYKDHGIIN